MSRGGWNRAEGWNCRAKTHHVSNNEVIRENIFLRHMQFTRIFIERLWCGMLDSGAVGWGRVLNTFFVPPGWRGNSGRFHSPGLESKETGPNKIANHVDSS
jgi:hypothetical protein